MAYQLGSVDSDGGAELYADPREREARPRFRGLVVSLVALVVIGVFAGGLWFAYQQGLRHGGSSTGVADIPLIRADERPTKVKPERPGGMEVPDRDKLIYNPSRTVIEHLLPPPEKPMPRPVPPPPAPSPPPQTEAAKSPAGATPVASAAPEAPAAAVQAAQPLQQAAVLPGKAPQAPSKPAGARGAGPRLQLGSLRSEEEARQEWERLKHKNADLLGSLSANSIRADLGDKGIYYRLQTAPVADQAAAERICAELKQRSIGCIIAR